MPLGLFALILSLLVPAVAIAHPLGFGTGELTINGDKLTGELVLEKHIDVGQALDADARSNELETLVVRNLLVQVDGEIVPLKVEVLALGDATRNVDVVRVSGGVSPGAAELKLGVRKDLGQLVLVVSTPNGKRSVGHMLRANKPLKTIALVNDLSKEAQQANGSAVPGDASHVIDGPPVPSEPVTPAAGLWFDYLALGFEHVLPEGLDHMLFVLGLFFLSRSFRELVLQLTVFTIAHSLTLLLSSWRIVNLPGLLVEVLIAASIAYVGLERYLPAMVQRLRRLVIFVFGLLHGMGFASAVAGTGFSAKRLLAELLAFNLGVEAAQLVVAAGALLLTFPWRRRDWYGRLVAAPACILIGLVGAYWVVQRLVS